MSMVGVPDPDSSLHPTALGDKTLSDWNSKTIKSLLLNMTMICVEILCEFKKVTVCVIHTGTSSKSSEVMFI